MTHKKQIHKVKKGEKLIGIAKKYKHKNWKTIWNAPENKKLVSKRKKPEQIQPGDVLIIPFNQAEMTDITQEITYWQQNLDADGHLVNSFDKRIKESRNTIAKLTKTAALSDQLHKSIVVELQKTAKGAKKWGTTVDAIATVAQLMINLGKLVKTGKRAMKLSGDELEKINKQLAKDALNMAYDPIAKEARKAGAKHVQNEKSGYSLALVSLGILSDSFDKMTSPSFWAWTVVRLKEGDSWSDAVTYDFQKEVKQKITRMIQEHKFAQAEIKRAIAAQQALISSMEKERKAALARIAAGRKRLKELEKLN